MKFSLGFVAITSLAASVFAAPSAVKRDACSSTVDETTYPSALSIVQSLKSSVDTYNASITSAHEAYVSSGDLATATTAYEGIVSSITDAFSSASSDVTALTGVDISSVETEFADCIASITKRQATDLETALEEILEELTASLSTIVDDLGLTDALSFLDPLLSALGNVLLALVPVVNDLLAVVEELLDGLLTGLGTGLAGIGLKQ